MKMKKKLFNFILATLTTFSLVLAGCSSSSSSINTSSNGNNTITLYTIDSTSPNYKNWVNSVEKATGLKIKTVAAPTDSDTRQQKVTTLLSTKDSSVDIFQVNDEMATSFKNSGWLEPLQNTVLTPDIRNQLAQGYVKDMLTSNKGDIIGVPSYQGYLSLWVDQKKLDAAGMKTINNMDDFIKFAKAATNPAKGQYGYGGSWEKTYVFNEIAQFVNLFGGDYYNWKNPGSREAVKFMWDMANTWKVTPVDQIADKYEQMDQKFNDGKYGMVFMWGTGDDYKNAGRYGQDQIHMINMPKFVKRSVFTDSWSYVLNSASKNKPAAIKFLKYVASKDGELQGWKDFNRYPARADVSKDPSVNGDVKTVYSQIQATSEIHGRPMVPQTMEFITAIGSLFQDYIQNKITLDQFCTQAQAAVDQYKPKN
jgi:multiple sugar transport system substrate-binding protein